MKVRFSAYVVFLVFQFLVLYGSAAGEEMGVSFVLEEVSNPVGSSCESDYVAWEVYTNGKKLEAGTCSGEQFNPLKVPAGKTLIGLRCDVPSLAWSGGPYTAKMKWCGAESDEFVFGEEPKLKTLSADEYSLPEGCGLKSCGILGEICDLNEKCVSCGIYGQCCLLDSSCCSNLGKNCGYEGNACGSDEDCVPDASTGGCYCKNPCAVSYDPDKWDFIGQVVNICYNYATDTSMSKFPWTTWPGYASGYNPEHNTCEDYTRGAELDGLVYVGSYPVECDGCAHLIAMVVADSPAGFHFYRRDADGYWSHKMGHAKPTNLDASGRRITNPETADRGRYTTFCGYFCVDKSKIRTE